LVMAWGFSFVQLLCGGAVLLCRPYAYVLCIEVRGGGNRNKNLLNRNKIPTFIVTN
jgi:hypothetical protein